MQVVWLPNITNFQKVKALWRELREREILQTPSIVKCLMKWVALCNGNETKKKGAANEIGG